MAAMVSYSASPMKASARVRPCTESAWMPHCSARRAMATPLRELLSQPVRILSVTGTSTACTTLSSRRATSASSRSSAEPAMTLQIFFAGQPMLMSMICAPFATLTLAASASMAGSAPTICTDFGSGSPSWLARRLVFSLPQSSELDATISDTASPAPSERHSRRNGRSVTPAMGATTRLFLSWYGPMRMREVI